MSPEATLATQTPTPRAEPEMCSGCACRKGSEANRTPETQAELRDAIESGEPFYCHESTTWKDDLGNLFWEPRSNWRTCAGWLKAISDRTGE